MIDLEKERKAFEDCLECDLTSVHFDLKTQNYKALDRHNRNDVFYAEKLTIALTGWNRCAKSKQHFVDSANSNGRAATRYLYQVIDMQAKIDALKAQIAELEKPNVCVWRVWSNYPSCSTSCGTARSGKEISNFCSVCGGKVAVQND